MSSESTTIITEVTEPRALDAARLDNAQLNGYFSTIEQEEVQKLLWEAIGKFGGLCGEISLKETEDEATSAQRNEQITLISRYRAILAPHKKLPFEILAIIFSACDESPTGQRYVYTHVCHTWRQIALGTPNLWNRIRVDYLTRGKEFGTTMMVKELISRSGGLPIHLACSVGPRVSGWSARCESDILDIVTSTSTQLRSLSLNLSGKCLLAPRLLSLPSALFDQLETLKIHAESIWKAETRVAGHAGTMGTEHSINSSSITILSNARNIRSIEFVSTSQLWGSETMSGFHAPWGQLTSLKLLTDIGMNMAHNILAQCNLLEYCEIMVVDNPQSETNGFPASLDNICLHNLRNFTVLVELYEDDCGIFIKSFVLPALLGLTFNRWTDSPEWAQFQGVTSLLDRSGCSLQTFSTDFEILDEHIKPLLEKMPTLTELKLMFDPKESETWPYPTYFSSITLQLMSCGKLVPKLHSLECPVVYPHLFVGMLERRQLWYMRRYPEDRDGGILKFHGICVYYQNLKNANQRLLKLEQSGPGKSYRLSRDRI